MRKQFWIWLYIGLLHGLVIVLLWHPQPLHFPTKADLKIAWRDAALYFERTLHPEQFAQAELAAQAAAQKRIADLPPALISRATPQNKVMQIRCPSEARKSQLHGSVFLIADISPLGRVGKVTVVEPSPNAAVNQLIVTSFSQARFKPAVDANQKSAGDQIHFTWPYDCR